MRERIRDGIALRLLLQRVVTDGGGSADRFFNVSGFEEASVAVGAACPDAGEAVGLQLEPH